MEAGRARARGRPSSGSRTSSAPGLARLAPIPRPRRLQSGGRQLGAGPRLSRRSASSRQVVVVGPPRGSTTSSPRASSRSARNEPRKAGAADHRAPSSLALAPVDAADQLSRIPSTTRSSAGRPPPHEIVGFQPVSDTTACRNRGAPSPARARAEARRRSRSPGRPKPPSSLRPRDRPGPSRPSRCSRWPADERRPALSTAAVGDGADAVGAEAEVAQRVRLAELDRLLSVPLGAMIVPVHVADSAASRSDEHPGHCAAGPRRRRSSSWSGSLRPPSRSRRSTSG